MARKGGSTAAGEAGGENAADQGSAGEAKRRRGRPKGSKNRASKAAAAEAAPRRRGRPKGSKNRATAAPKTAAVARRRGRPRKAEAAGLTQRLDALIRQLEVLRTEVDRLESEARQLDQIRAALR